MPRNHPPFISFAYFQWVSLLSWTRRRSSPSFLEIPVMQNYFLSREKQLTLDVLNSGQQSPVDLFPKESAPSTGVTLSLLLYTRFVVCWCCSMDFASSNLPFAPLKYVLITHSSTASSTEFVSLGDIGIQWTPVRNSKRKRKKNDDWQRQSLRIVWTLELQTRVGD